LHRTRLHRDARIELRAVLGDAEKVVALGGDLDQRVAAGEEAQVERLAIGAHFGADMRAGPQLLQRADLGQARDVRTVDAEALDESGERIATLEELFTEIG